MSDIITVVGIIGTDPRYMTTTEGLTVGSFRLATQPKNEGGQVNWYSVVGYRDVAEGIGSKLHKGSHVIVTGSLKVRQFSSRITIDIEASTIGLDIAERRSTASGHTPVDWFTPSTYPSCSCGFDPHDNLALIQHWRSFGLRYVDGRLSEMESNT